MVRASRAGRKASLVRVGVRVRVRAKLRAKLRVRVRVRVSVREGRPQHLREGRPLAVLEEGGQPCDQCQCACDLCS